MVDPHLMLMLMQVMGKKYNIWDKSADIEFVKPGKGVVSSILKITDSDLAAIKENTAAGEKYFHTFNVTVMDGKKDIVARIRKVLYIRKKTGKIEYV